MKRMKWKSKNFLRINMNERRQNQWKKIRKLEKQEKRRKLLFFVFSISLTFFVAK